MTLPSRSAAELITAAQADGWDDDPLGKEILAELAQRREIISSAGAARARKNRTAIIGLSVALLVSLLTLAWMFAANGRLEEKASSTAIVGTQAKANEDSIIAVERSKADEAVKQAHEMVEELKKANTDNLKQLTDEMMLLKAENTRLIDEATTARVRAEKSPTP